MAISPPATSGTSPMSGIYASLRQAQMITRLRRINPRNTQCMDAFPAVSGKHFETAADVTSLRLWTILSLKCKALAWPSILLSLYNIRV